MRGQNSRLESRLAASDEEEEDRGWEGKQGEEDENIFEITK